VSWQCLLDYFDSVSEQFPAFAIAPVQQLGHILPPHPSRFSLILIYLDTHAHETIQPRVDYTHPTHPDSHTLKSTQEMIHSHSHYLLNTYARPPLLFTHGKGLTLTDSSNRDYLDFTAGIAVTALGHSDSGINAVVAEQGEKLSHASNVYWNEWAGELAKGLIERTREHGGLGLSKGVTGEGGSVGGKVFFSNSGTEANEGALKFARKYGKEFNSLSTTSSTSSSSPTSSSSTGKKGIVCFSNAFHGRTFGALSVTPNPKYQAPFTPLIPGVRVGELNNMDEERMKGLLDESVCGVIVEPIQGEGGVQACQVEWLEMLGRRCREVGAVLIYDEIQVSVGD